MTGRAGKLNLRFALLVLGKGQMSTYMIEPWNLQYMTGRVRNLNLRFALLFLGKDPLSTGGSKVTVEAGKLNLCRFVQLGGPRDGLKPHWGLSRQSTYRFNL